MDETYVKVGGQWKYLYRAVDKDGVTTDFLLRAKRDHAAARAFFGRAIDLHGRPENITIDKSGSNTAAIVSFQADSGLAIELRQSKYLNNIVEQDRLAIKRITRSTLGFQDFSMRTHPDRRHRDDAHDSQRPTLRHQRPSHGAGHSVLLPGFLIETGRVASFAYAALSRQNRNIF